MTAHAELIFEKLLTSFIRCFIERIVVNFWVCPPSPDPAQTSPSLVTQYALLATNISRQFTQHMKVASWVKGGNRVNKAKNEILYFFRSISCTNVSIHGCYCCKTGIEVSKCVYLACMAVKIEHTVSGHNHDILQQCISDASWSMGPLPSFCGCASQFVSYLVVNPEDRFTRDEAQIW